MPLQNVLQAIVVELILRPELSLCCCYDHLTMDAALEMVCGAGENRDIPILAEEIAPKISSIST